MDISLLFLAKPLDKHSITLMHIIYPALISFSTFEGHLTRKSEKSATNFVAAVLCEKPIIIEWWWHCDDSVGQVEKN